MARQACTVDDCRNAHHAHGLCGMHYQLEKRHGDPAARMRRPRGSDAPPCAIDDCERPAVTRGWCDRHYRTWKRNGDPLLTHSNHQPCHTPDANARRLAGLAVGRKSRGSKYTPQQKREIDARRKREQARMRRLLRKSAAEPTRDTREYVTILRRDPCSYCGAPSEHVDHVVPVKSGGSPDWTNLTAACARCNYLKSAKPLLLFMLGRLSAA